MSLRVHNVALRKPGNGIFVYSDANKIISFIIFNSFSLFPMFIGVINENCPGMGSFCFDYLITILAGRRAMSNYLKWGVNLFEYSSPLFLLSLGLAR